MGNYFQNKVVIVTGSSIGIGRELIRQLLGQGASVVMNARNADRLAASAREMALATGVGERILSVAGDVSRPEDCAELVTKTVEHYGRLDVLINNAGISQQGTVAELPPEVFRKVIDVNLMGSVYPTHYALPHLRKTKGRILFVGSASGIRGLPKYAPYASSKMALTALAESLKLEETPHGVSVSLAYVGFTENDPQKVIYDEDGKIIPQPDRSFVKQEPVEVVAARLLSMIEKRRFKQVFSPIGKLFKVLNTIAPWFIDWQIGRRYRKEMKQ